MSEKDGGSAFPVPHDALVDRGGCVQGYAHEHMPIESGMSLRDYFAAKAMTGCLAYSHIDSTRGNWQENASPQMLAVFSYQVADAMLKARGQ